MLRLRPAALAALILVGSPCLANAQNAPGGGASLERLTGSEFQALTDARIAIVKFALQMTPDQEKLWPPVEEAIRARAAGRQARLAEREARVNELRNGNAIEVLRDRNPVDFLRRRADALAQRSAEVRRLADAWEPLYQTLNADQKRRLGIAAILVFRDMRDQVEDRLLENTDTED
ncbi:Spy/CpxP family protein refolding chaperone [Mesorhizobium sp. BAC0120]|uniref:Spy/CpxP family protein refolding chaperone n=1 Tax=Mesorhizobium sp. BAC0120 TaxID=3090670 RepID=UPI00298BE572|nr:Spy/CpxP family protein refolding chaperone [Mesorhizobium sp. BAC0120]MDW6021016.1 Spy/CpxP family protein refolding chaperone [Mesorhizobium sp. BAC0120]